MSPEARRCLELAEQAIGLSDPNPRVGCVIVTRSGQRVEGHTHAAGGLHAEAHALVQAAQSGLDLRGATAWVSLEPCSHHGRTPPCSGALIQSGVARVEVACLDPNPLVSGRGVQALRAAGVEVQVHEGDWAEQARAMNIGFMSRMERGRPWVRLKVAASLDGTTALLNGRSQWITSAAARTDGHHWRRRAGAVLTGIGTVRDDNPRLDVREAPCPIQPLRVVVDSRLAISPEARILQAPGRALVYTAIEDPMHPVRQALQKLPGVEVAVLPTVPTAATGEGSPTGAREGRADKTDLSALMCDLAARGINELHVEAGEKLNGSLLRAGVVDELLVYLAPRLLGRGRGLAAVFDPPLEALDHDLPLAFIACEPVGADLRLRALTAQGLAAYRTPR
jgi:diaminohydroxyphosphoribosylaminopyrimidine deaminase/5-amino-6-(5-phosphoribosylamino)uracil reductase